MLSSKRVSGVITEWENGVFGESMLGGNVSIAVGPYGLLKCGNSGTKTTGSIVITGKTKLKFINPKLISHWGVLLLFLLLLSSMNVA